MKRQSLELNPLTGAMGAEIRGIDLSRASDDETFGAVHQALLEYGVIFFRDQDITPAQQTAFARRWGEIHFHPHMPCLPGHPGVIEIVKKEDDTTVFGENWHTDSTYLETPPLAVVMRGVDVPEV
ncbi:MAG: TauD/TfdA dioxygenase family protein, partial [Burkholderiales bacterium]